jgi:hypothetical protein
MTIEKELQVVGSFMWVLVFFFLKKKKRCMFNDIQIAFKNLQKLAAK